MKHLKIAFTFLLITALISCGRNDPQEKNDKKNILSETTKEIQDTTDVKNAAVGTDLNATIENQKTTVSTTKNTKNTTKNSLNPKDQIIVTTPEKEAEAVINSPLRNLLNNGQIGKSYTKKELIENYKFPKEAVDLIKQVTYVGPNKLYFKWGSTWLVEKVSDAEFENDTLIFTFKQNKTYVSGGAIGIKYNKKIYTELILNKGAAYIPTVKGYHWDINK
jgi:hypothetical protein